MSAPRTKHKKLDSKELYARLERLAIMQAVKEAGLEQVRSTSGPPKAKGPSVKQDDKKRYHYTIAEFDVLRTLEPDFEQAETLHLEGAELPWEVTVEMGASTFKKIEKSVRLEQFHLTAKQEYDAAIKVMQSKILLANHEITGLADMEMPFAAKEKEAQKAARKLFEEIAKEATAASEKAKVRCVGLLNEWKKEDKELGMWYFNAAVKIGGAVGTIIGSAATIAGTMGGSAPVAIFGLSRGILGIGQEVTRLSLKANQRYELIQAELVVLRKAMSGVDKQQNTTINSMKELAANILAKGSGLELPSIKNFNTHVKDYKMDVIKLKHKLDSFGAKYNKYLDEQTKFVAKLAEADLPAAKRAKIQKAYDEVIRLTAKMPDKVAKALDECSTAVRQHKMLDEIGVAMKKGQAGWIPYVDSIVGAAMDIGLVFVSEGPDLPKVIENTQKAVSIVQSAAQLVLDEFSEATGD